MISIKHFITPRAGGKTTTAIKILNSVDNAILFTNSIVLGHVRDMVKDIGIKRNKVKPVLIPIMGGRYEKIIIDDYLLLFKEHRYKFLDWVNNFVLNSLHEDGELILFSSPYKFYDKNAILLSAFIEGNNIDKYSHILNIEDIKSQIDEINSSFLNPSKVDIYKNTFNSKYFTSYEIEQLKKSLGSDGFSLFVKGEFIK